MYTVNRTLRELVNGSRSPILAEITRVGAVLQPLYAPFQSALPTEHNSRRPRDSGTAPSRAFYHPNRRSSEAVCMNQQMDGRHGLFSRPGSHLHVADAGSRWHRYRTATTLSRASTRLRVSIAAYPLRELRLVQTLTLDAGASITPTRFRVFVGRTPPAIGLTTSPHLDDSAALLTAVIYEVTFRPRTDLFTAPSPLGIFLAYNERTSRR